MAYTPTTWATGDTITASAMNKLENGVANAGSAMILTTTVIGGNTVLDHTMKEIYDAISSGTPVYFNYTYGAYTDYVAERCLAPVISFYKYDNAFRIAISKPFVNQAVGGTFYLALPALAIYGTADINSNPAKIKTVYVPDTYCSAT